MKPFAIHSPLFIIILTFMCLTLVNCQISLMKQYQSKHALAHVIQSLREGRLQQMDDEYDKKCTMNSVCCLCNKNFKNASFLQLHMSLQHPIQSQTPQDQMLGYIFEKRINSELRFEMCIKLLQLTDLSQLSHIHQALNLDNSSNLHPNSSVFLTPLSKTQTVDTCTIIAYGAYNQPLWRVWIKGTLIFVFVVVFIVYYANIIDEINLKYFPKKEKSQRHQLIGRKH